MRLVAAATALLVLGAAGAGAGSGSFGLPVVPAGFGVEMFAQGLSHPTAMAYGPDGRIYVTETDGALASISRGTRKPRVLLRGLRTPLGLAWSRRTLFLSEEGRLDTGRSFPRAYRGSLFVAEWGQYDSRRFGRRVVRVELKRDGHARRVVSFASGFEHPLALLVDRRGGLLVADWGRGVVYRIQADGRP